MTIEALSLSLIETAVNRGHGPFRRSRMTPNITVTVTPETRIIQRFTCATCHTYADADTRPPPNGIDIGGEMVALNCGDETHGI